MKAAVLGALLLVGLTLGEGAGAPKGAVEEASLLASIDSALSEAQAAMDQLYQLKGYAQAKTKRKNNWEFIRFGRR